MTDPENDDRLIEAVEALARKLQAIAILMARRDPNAVGVDPNAVGVGRDLYSESIHEFLAEEILP